MARRKMVEQGPGIVDEMTQFREWRQKHLELKAEHDEASASVEVASRRISSAAEELRAAESAYSDARHWSRVTRDELDRHRAIGDEKGWAT